MSLTTWCVDRAEDGVRSQEEGERRESGSLVYIMNGMTGH